MEYRNTTQPLDTKVRAAVTMFEANTGRAASWVAVHPDDCNPVYAYLIARSGLSLHLSYSALWRETVIVG